MGVSTAIFYQQRSPNFFSNSFFITLHAGRIVEETCPLTLEMRQLKLRIKKF